MSNNFTYSIHPVQTEDVDDVMSLLKKTFYIDEPLNEAVGLCIGLNSCKELDEYCQHSLQEGLSLKAVDCKGNIVGVMINGLCPVKEDTEGNDVLSQAYRCTNPKFRKILFIMARREKRAKLWERFPNDEKLVEVKVAATDPLWRRRGIMHALLEQTEQLARQRQVRILRMDTSSAYSAKSAQRLGFKCVYRAAYTDIHLDGRPIIVPEEPHIYDRVNVKELF